MTRKIEGLEQPPAPAAISKLSDLPRLEKSLRDFLRSTDEYAALVAEAKEDAPDGVAAAIADNSPDPMTVLSTLVFGAALPHLDADHYHCQVDVTLHIPVEPVFTNGEWDETEKTVSWSRSAYDGAMPTMLVSAWCVPDDVNQVRIFGRSALGNEELAEYVTWYHGLTSTEQAQWDKMLASIDSSADTVETLQAFQFPDSPKLAKPIIHKLVGLLKKKQPDQAISSVINSPPN
ncbi:MAG: hypothetical protein WBD31_01825 [Rubripirellula sp.]